MSKPVIPGHPNGRDKPCPNLPKGPRCPLCGGAFVCLQTWRKKKGQP